MDKSYLDDPEIREGLLQVLIAEGWFSDFAESSFPEYEECEIPDIPDIPEDPEGDKRGWQQLKERLQREGLMAAE